MKYMIPEEILPNILGILLISHGTLAEGLLEAGRMILGDLDNVAALCFEGDCDPEDFGQKIAETMDLFPAGCVVLADLMGGTPFNQLMLATPGRRVRTVCGVNLSMLTEVVSSREGLSLEELAHTAVEAGTAGVVDVEEFMKKRMMNKGHSK